MNTAAIPHRTLVTAAVLALLLLLQAASLLAPLDRFLEDRRYVFGDRAASGEVVFLALDKRSLDAVGVWPWPRTIHADLIDRLRELGARQIFFDIDFSTPSTPEVDAAFAAAIERASGTVTLPVFLQLGEAGDPDAVPIITEPTRELAEHAWLGTVNVFPDWDGKFRRFPTGQQAGESFIESFPATIAGVSGDPGTSIEVDFGIDPATVPVISVQDVLAGKVDLSDIENKTIVVGAYAAELNDFFGVPRFSFIPGAMLQIIAAETVMAGRDLRTVDALPVAVPVFCLLLAIIFALGRRESPRTLLIFAAIPLVAEPAAIIAYVEFGLLVPTAFTHVSALAALAIRSLSMTELFSTLMREATAEARNMRQVLQQVVRENFDAIVITDENGNVLQASDAAGDVFDIEGAAPRVGAPASGFLPAKLTAEIAEALTRFRAGAAPATETRMLTFTASDGAARAIEYTIAVSELNGGKTSGRRRAGKIAKRFVACLTARDISERLSYETRLKWISDHDGLTGLRLRHSFVSFVKATMDESTRSCGYAIIALNLHRFKTVNIALGRDTGNAVLTGVAARLRDADPRILAQARLGGDSFAVLLGGVFDEAEALKATEEIAAKIMAPFAIERRRAQVGIQAGVTLCAQNPVEEVDAEAMMERAEMALDEARTASGLRIVLFDQALAGHRLRARIIERDLWQALERDELHLHYQMQTSLKDNTPSGAEALLRWTHPKLGPVSPEDFIPIAEANGFIVELGRWTLRQACRDAARWPERLSVSVNIAPKHFASDEILQDVRNALRRSGLAPHRLTVEIVESEFLDTTEAMIRRIKALKALGVKLGLDDFGTGYSAMGYLSKLHFDEIKIDKRFISDLTTNPQTQGIIRSVATLAEAFEMTIVCEGVETLTQAAFLRLIGCHKGQGYLYSRPLDAEAFRALIDGDQDAKARA